VLTRYEFCIAFLLIECVRKENTLSALIGSANRIPAEWF
jgi:hypothetical protein